MNDDSTNEFSRELRAGMPSPRDDEPASLRQDIVDELADHLSCAHQREQLLIGDGTAAGEQRVNERVLIRFGSPAALARRLWFDWMWEKIAMQRTTLVLMIALVACCAAMVAMVWKTNEATRSALVSSQEAQAAMLAKLTELSNSPTVSQPPDWNPLKVRLVYDDEERTPVEGAEIRITGKTDDTKRIPSSKETTDSNGLSDFGMVLFGEYYVSIKDPKTGNQSTPVVAVRPGRDKVHEFVCPASATLKPKLEMAKPTGLFEREFDEQKIWYRLTCHYFASMDVMSALKGRWGSHPPQEEINVTFWMTPFGLTVSQSQFEEMTQKVDKPDSTISRFPAEVYELPSKIPNQPVELYRGQYHVTRAEMFLSMQSKNGTNYLVGVPKIPVKSYVGDLSEFNASHQNIGGGPGMMMGGGEYSYEVKDPGGPDMFGNAAGAKTTRLIDQDPLKDYLHYVAAQNRSHQRSFYINHVPTFSVYDAKTKPEYINSPQMDVMLFSIAAQIKEDKTLVLIDAICEGPTPSAFELTPIEIVDSDDADNLKGTWLSFNEAEKIDNYEEPGSVLSASDSPENLPKSSEKRTYFRQTLFAIDAAGFEELAKKKRDHLKVRLLQKKAK